MSFKSPTPLNKVPPQNYFIDSSKSKTLAAVFVLGYYFSLVRRKKI